MATLLQLCQPFDHAVMAAIQQLSSTVMDKIMLAFTFFGNRHYNFFLNLFTQKLWWIFPLFIHAVLGFFVLLTLIPKGKKEKAYEG